RLGIRLAVGGAELGCLIASHGALRPDHIGATGSCAGGHQGRRRRGSGRLAGVLEMNRRPLRVAVYAIARDEEAHVARWAASAAGADVRIVVDTGSTDATVSRALSSGIAVHCISVEPFRYDEARNRALDLVPDDVDVCMPLDLDEVLES